MLKIERHNLIDQEIRKQGYVLVPDLSGLLGCSEETIRRDLKEMEKAGKLVRTHGGAYLVEKYDKGYPIELRKSYLQHTKERLAEAAMAELKENDVIMLDASTTCLTIAEAILNHRMQVTLITNSLAICKLFADTNSDVTWRRSGTTTPMLPSSAAPRSASSTVCPTTTSARPMSAGRCSGTRRERSLCSITQNSRGRRTSFLTGWKRPV